MRSIMRVKLKNEGSPARIKELDRLRKKMGTELPSDYLDFLSLRNGCRIKNNIFSIKEDNQCGVNAFLDIDSVIKEKKSLGRRLSKNTWPVADSEGGNYVCLRFEESGSWCVVFWDHELEQETVINSNFSEFLESLDNFDPSGVELEADQVISVWIDPKFLEENEDLFRR